MFQLYNLVPSLTARENVAITHNAVITAITTWSGTDVLRVPSTALFRAGARWAVFVIRDGAARLVPVDLGPTDGDWTAVERGLSDGDAVVAHPTDQIRDGVRVRVRGGHA